MSDEIKIQLRYSTNNEIIIRELSLNINENLENLFNKNINIIGLQNIQNEPEFHLIRGNQRIFLNKNAKIENLNLREGDLISLSFQNNNIIINNNTQNLHANHNISSANLNEENDPNINNYINLSRKNNKYFILIFALIALLLIGIAIFLVIYIKEKKKKEIIEQEPNHNNYSDNATEAQKVYNIEELITKKRPYYLTNMLYLYKSDKIMKIFIENRQKMENYKLNTTTIEQYMDFGLLIRDENQEILEEQNLTKKWFTGYLYLLNLTINNGTHDMHLSYNEELHKSIQNINKTNRRNLRKLSESRVPLILNDVKELCFVKVNFYENGEIKDIFYPEEFNLNLMVYINKIAKLIIPKLSKNLYTENIDQKIAEINNQLEEEDEEEEEEEEEYIENSLWENEFEQEIFDENSENDIDISEDKKSGILLRKNSEFDSDNIEETNDLNHSNVDKNNNNNTDEFDYINGEEELEEENSYSLNNDSIKYIFKGIEENETFSNITDFDQESLESVQAKLEGSMIRIIKNSFIDEKGMLVFIEESENVTIIQPTNESFSQLTKEEEKLKSEIYNENNFVERNDDEDFIGKNITFNLSKIKTENYNNISLYKNIIDEEFAANIFKYFDKLSYKQYNKTDDNENKFRILKDFKEDFLNENKAIDSSEIEVEHSKLPSKIVKKRNLQSSGSYYGMKNIENEKILFKYNLIGLILEGIVVSKIDVSNGKCTSYLKLTFGFISLKFKFKTMQTNQHIISKNSNQMTYNLMGLLYYSNEDLIKRNQIYSDFIINLEKNVSKLYEKYYDYSGLFRDSLDNLYNEVKNFSGIIFDELIELIERVYDNYTNILNKVENNEYQIISEIREITKNEYINYINEMFILIISYKNDTLLFMENLNHEVKLIQTFQIDILFDIIDLIYDSTLVLKDFIKKLFKAVDRGVTTFKYDLREYMEEIIGQLLYLTDFLSVNINKNEILKNAISLEKRQKVTLKLKNFRNIILRIIEILNNHILNDYEEEISSNKENSIRYSKEYIIKNCIDDIDNNSNIIIDDIKTKIYLMNYYESYAENIQIINEIMNKSLIEFNNDMYEQVLINIKNISPEYLDAKSALIINKNNLFTLSNNITNVINEEINDINNYISSYSSKYINDNNYLLDYNIYYFRKYFTNKFISSILNEFRTIIKDTLQNHYMQLINNNYALAFQYMEDVYNHFSKAKKYRILGKVFINTYTKYKSTFQEMAYLTSSDEFLDFITDNFYNVSNYVINYVNEKLESINKYYFNETNKYEKNWYKLDLIKQEIKRLINNINNFFDENTLNLDIKQTVLNISLNEIPELNKKKEKKLDDLYNKIYKLAQDEKINSQNCEVIQLKKKKKRLWYSLWIAYKIVHHYYCKVKVESRNNINKIVNDLSQTKKYLSQKINNLINNYINKFDVYLNNYIYYSQTLYDNLYNYTEKKIKNNENIQLLLDEYKIIFEDILANNTEEKIQEKIYLKNDMNLTNIFSKLENNIFEINHKFYQNYYLENRQFYLEYPDEILLKLNQSIINLNSNTQIIKNKINLAFSNRINYIVSSTKLFFNDFNEFNLNYIMNKVNTEDIFNNYSFYKINILQTFFNSCSLYLNNTIEIEKQNELFLNQENYDFFINRIENNYSNISENLYIEIDENFSIYNCTEFINDESFFESNITTNNTISLKKCDKQKFISDKNYSKYNFNIVKFRTEISNSRKFTEMFEQLFENLNYKNIMDSNEIIEIDNSINTKNIIYISNESKFKVKEINNKFLSLIKESFDEFCDEFVKQTTNLTNNYWQSFDYYKNILNLENSLYNNNVSQTFNNISNNIAQLLDDFNSTLFNYLKNIKYTAKNYDYYHINFTNVFNNYSSILESSLNYYIDKINNLKDNNLFYSIPKIIANKIYFSKRRDIENIISNFSNKYNFDSIGFKYDLSKEFDEFLELYYTNYEYNNSNNYFELFNINNQEYINALFNNISKIKNSVNEAINLIFENAFNYAKNESNFVQKEYIKNIKKNNSRCSNVLNELYMNISYDLNNTNMTESEDFIINNCTIEKIIDNILNNSYNDNCKNISEINETFYYDEFYKIFLDCQNKSFYNYSYIIIENFKEEEKINLDEIISNFNKTLIANLVDENYLYNYMNKQFFINKSLEINMNNFQTYFEDIEDLNIYINNLNEPEYKKLINNLLIDSFNQSYTNIINLYIKDEIIAKINSLINNKLDIFIDYFLNKFGNDLQYYSLLLEKMEELGNSSKISIFNLFSKIPKKLNESIYYLIEDEIFYYIDIFFRENKNIFINNFIDFYINIENHFNLNIYNIENYVIEMLSDRNFNKTLNNISSNLILEIKNKVKENVRNITFDKMKSFIEQCDIINKNIQIKLNQIDTNKLPEDMVVLVNLINEQSMLVDNQNNRFLFNMGERPFNTLNIFINETLEPPLLLIFEKYNLIETELLNRIKALAEEFPDAYSEVKKYLLENKINSTDYFINEINSTLFEYHNILVNELKNYFNKLIHFAYIDGLKTINTPCQESDCGLPSNSFRRLNNREIMDIVTIYKNHHNLQNINEIKEKINKNVNFGIKRKTSQLPEFTPHMGALSEDDVIYYLSNLQNTTLKLNKSFFGKDYLNINLTSNKFMQKINFTYLEKLRLSFDIKLVKFSTILTENSLTKLKNIILFQFYLIEEYVHQSSDLVQHKINYFCNELNKTSEFLQSLSGYIYNQIMGYYNILYSTIQNQYRNLDEVDEIPESAYTKKNKYTKTAIAEIMSIFQTDMKLDFNLTHILNNCLNLTTLGKIMDKLSDYTKIGKSFNKTIPIPFPLFPYLQIRITLGAYAGIGFYTSIEPDWKKLKFSLILDFYAEAKVPINIEGGLYIPESPEPISIAFVVGLDGIIGHGKAGLKLEIHLNNEGVDFDAYFIFNALVFEFYIQFRIEINLSLFNYGFHFDLIRIELFGFHIEFHSLKKAQKEAFDKNHIGKVTSPIGIGFLKPEEI